MAETAELSNLTKYITLSLFGVLNGFLIGRGIKTVENYCWVGQATQVLNQINTDEKFWKGWDVKFTRPSDGKSLILGVKPKGAQDSSYVRYIMNQDYSLITKIQDLRLDFALLSTLFGSVLTATEVLAFVYPPELNRLKCVLGIAAMTCASTAYFSGVLSDLFYGKVKSIEQVEVCKDINVFKEKVLAFQSL